MKISTKGRYALAIMIYLAKKYKDDVFVSLKEISENENISLKYLEKIMISLNKNDYFIVLRGANGGYKLKYSPEKYIIGDILRTSEGDLSPVKCLTNNSYCMKQKKCGPYDFYNGLYKTINKYIDSKSLKDLI